MKSYVEHASITLTDVDEALAFFAVALPDFNVRNRGEVDGRDGVHLGTEETYVALAGVVEKVSEDGKRGERRVDTDRVVGFNHVGFVVEDLPGLRDRAKAGS